jgi:hypothetical protein
MFDDEESIQFKRLKTNKNFIASKQQKYVLCDTDTDDEHDKSKTVIEDVKR